MMPKKIEWSTRPLEVQEFMWLTHIKKFAANPELDAFESIIKLILSRADNQITLDEIHKLTLPVFMGYMEELSVVLNDLSKPPDLNNMWR